MGEWLVGGAARTHTTFIHCLVWAQFVVPQNNYHSNTKDHWSQIIINIIIIKSLKYCENYQNFTQRHEVSKCCWENGRDKLSWCRVATDLLFVKTTVSPKNNNTKHKQTRYAFIVLFNAIFSHWSFIWPFYPLLKLEYWNS